MRGDRISGATGRVASDGRRFLHDVLIETTEPGPGNQSMAHTVTIDGIPVPLGPHLAIDLVDPDGETVVIVVRSEGVSLTITTGYFLMLRTPLDDDTARARLLWDAAKKDGLAAGMPDWLQSLARHVDGGPCEAEEWSWHHYSPEHTDPYWIRCSRPLPHDEHGDDGNTGLTWTDPPDPTPPTTEGAPTP